MKLNKRIKNARKQILDIYLDVEKLLRRTAAPGRKRVYESGRLS